MSRSHRAEAAKVGRQKPQVTKEDENATLVPDDQVSEDTDEPPQLQYYSTRRGGLSGELDTVLSDTKQQARSAAHQFLKGADSSDEIAQVKDGLSRVKMRLKDQPQLIDASAPGVLGWQMLDGLRTPSVANTISEVATADEKGDQKKVPYRLGAKIGDDSFGIIYEGVQQPSGVPVAVKFVSGRGAAFRTRGC